MTIGASAERVCPSVSIVVPVYNGGAFIAESLNVMIGTLERLDQPFELLVVSDGSRDDTAAQARLVDDPRVIVLEYPDNQGKGHAISHGLARARGALIGWLDADLDLHPDVILDAVQVFDAAGTSVDAVIGSKRHPRSSVAYPVRRRILSWGFHMLVRMLFRIRVRDTQVGAKLLRRELVETVRPLLLIKRYAFDLEVLAVGAEFGFDRIVETPVKLSYQFTGSGIDVPAVHRMFIDTLAIAYRIHIRHWYVRRFAALQRDRAADTAARDHDAEGSGFAIS